MNDETFKPVSIRHQRPLWYCLAAVAENNFVKREDAVPIRVGYVHVPCGVGGIPDDFLNRGIESNMVIKVKMCGV